MKQLASCNHCGGFLPGIAVKCPHCGKTDVVRAVGGVAATLAAMGAFSSTLAACYGPPCANDAGCYELRDGSVSVRDAASDGSTPTDAEADAGTTNDH